MTEKRFILDDDGIVVDMVDLSMCIDNEDCCEKLNEVAEENKELKVTTMEMEDYLARMEEENKKLREQLKDCTKKAKEEIRKQAENDAIRWANIGR